jgi:Protein of unknown function (DUF2867)
MRLPNSAHTARPWRIHEITPDLRLYDVWALPTPGGPEDFPRLVHQFAVGDTADNPSWFARTLFAIHWKLGAPRRCGGISGPDGCSGEAEWSVWEGIHGRDRTFSASDRLPAPDSWHRRGVAGWR